MPLFQIVTLNFCSKVINYILNFAHFLPKKWKFGLIIVLFGWAREPRQLFWAYCCDTGCSRRKGMGLGQ